MPAGRIGRPFYFLVPFWGRRYREYFANLCLPSLLAPENLPLLRAEDGHRFLIATTAEDWQAIADLPVMERLRRSATPEWIEVDTRSRPSAAGASALEQYSDTIRLQNDCQKRLVEAAFRDRAYGSLLFPDTLISNGMVAALLRHARAGKNLVLCTSLRQSEEAVLADLRSAGLLPSGAPLSQTATALTIPPRVMGDLLVRHLHPEMSIYEEGHPGQPHIPPFKYWRVPGGRGIIQHTFFANPVLMNYGVVSKDHAVCLDHHAFEQVYIGTNFSTCGGVHVVQDSDEFGILSLTPASVNWSPASTAGAGRAAPGAATRQACGLREAMWIHAGKRRDVVRRDLLAVPIRWHAGDIDEAWLDQERRIGRDILRGVGDFIELGAGSHPDCFPSRYSLDPRYLRLELASRGPGFVAQLVDLFQRRKPILDRVCRAWRGEREARAWLAGRPAAVWRRLRGVIE